MREKWRLHQGWYFKAEDYTENLSVKGPKEHSEIWEEVTLPHTFRLEPYTHRGVKTAQGIGTYVKYFSLDNAMQKKNLYITFDAVMGVTDVWLNGVLLHTKLADKTSTKESGVHTNYGGYLPFVVNLNGAAYFDGRDNELVVRVDNRDNGQVPPGKPQELLDFTYFGGIYRDVWMEAVEDIFVTDPLYEDVINGGGIVLNYPFVSKEKAVVLVKTHLRSNETEEKEITLLHEIIGEDGKPAADWMERAVISSQDTKEILTELEVEYPNLWNLEHPHLYQLVTSIYVEGILTDQVKTRFGIRQIEVDRTKGVLINGEVQPFLSGVNRHQDYPVIGNAAPASMQRRDAILFKEAGFKIIRAAHYPMSEEFLNACDELGLLLFEATPGWQWYPTDEPEPFTSRVRNNIRQMVRRDRNHPCVLAYETVLNETYHVPHGFSRESALTALEEHDAAKIAAESYGYNAAPEANGIDREADFIYGFQEPLEKTEKAVMFLREYTDLYTEFYGEFESRRVTRGTADGFFPHGEARNLVKANQMLWRHLGDEYSLAKCYELRKENPAFIGAAIWTGIDSRGAGSIMSPCGIWDGYRLPKTSYWAYASQQDEKPVLYLATEWTEEAPILDKAGEEIQIGTDELREIYVYSNATSVTLTVELGENVIWEMTSKPYTEENAGYLPHPPFYFADVPYKKGTVLRARGYDENDNLIAEDERKTAGEPHHIRLYADFHGVPMQADGNDLVLVRAEILDENGIRCGSAEPRVYFEVEGEAGIVGDGDLLAETNPAQAEAGIASAYLRAGTTPGTVRVSASAKDLCKDSAEIIIQPYKQPCVQTCMQPQTSPAMQHVSAPANLSSHPMCGKDGKILSVEAEMNSFASADGDAELISLAAIDGEVFPESILLKGTACWKLNGETYLQLGSRVQSGDREAELFIYQDDVLRWYGKADQAERITLLVEGAKEMKAEVHAESPTEVLLLSPYLWKGEVTEEVTELSVNIAFGKPAKASVNEANAEAMWHGGAWFGKNPREGLQEWQVDLGETYDVRNAMVQVGGQMGSDCTFYQYEIHTSADGEHWEKQTENRRTSWSNGVLDYFTAQNVRYVKVVFISVDGRLVAGIKKFEIYRDYGVDNVKEYALKGITVENNTLVFDANCLEYKLPKQEELTIRALAMDENAQVIICGTEVLQTEGGKITSAQPVTVKREDCNGNALIEVRTASGRGMRTYQIHF